MSRPTFWLGLGIAAVLGCGGSIGQEGDPSGDQGPAPSSPRTGTNPGSPSGAGGQGTEGVTPPPMAAPSCKPGTPLAAPAPVRRLTRREYNYTVRDLLGDTTSPAKDFILDAHVGLFENNADAPLTALSANQYAEAAETLARTAVTNRLGSIAPCATAGGDDGCAREFVRNFGKRAYRRPLTDAEVARLFGVYAIGKMDGGYAQGVRMALQTMLQSPHFINHVERGVPGAAGPDVPLTPYEVASRLSYFLWNTMPDSALFAAADAGKLSTAAEVEAQATRMLADRKAQSGVFNFFHQWLELEKVDKLDRSTKMFPEWSSSLRTAMREETRRFVEEVVWRGDARLTTLLTASWSLPNAPLAKLYGVEGPADAMTYARTDLDPKQRAGLLTHASILSLTAHFDQTSPVHRGLLVRERFLCQTTPSPPPEVDVSLPKHDPRMTTRERYAKHQSDPYCAGCHRLIDDIGLGFEGYDPIGRVRTTENGKPVDTSGQIVATRDLDGKFNGVVELTTRLARSAEVYECVASQWLAYAIGSPPSELACATERLGAEFAASGTDIKKLVLSVTRSDAFRHRRAISREVCR